MIEQQGRPVALGVVLHGDGRIVTASSRITPGQLFVRFEDNTSLAARVGHMDPAADLALLVPQSAKWQKGLKAERGPGKSDSFALFTSGANRKLEARNVKVLGTGQTRKQPTLQLSASLKPTDLGGPILNEQGEVIAIAVNGCEAPITTCKEAPVGLPIAAVRRFLAVRPAEAAFPVPVLGVTGTAVDTKVVRGLRLTAVEPKSPAAALKLRVEGEEQERDILVAVAGEPVTTPEELNTVLTRHAAGERVELLLFGVNGYRSVAVRLAPPAPTAKPLPVPQLGL